MFKRVVVCLCLVLFFVSPVVLTGCTSDGPTGQSGNTEGQDVGMDSGDSGASEPDTNQADTELEPDDASPDGDAGALECDPNPCAVNERCVIEDGALVCVPLSCDELDCAETETCEEDGAGGFECVDGSCEDDGECLEEEFCDGICVADLCVANARVCQDGVLMTCRANGSGQDATPCASAAAFDSVCVEPVPGEATCSCQDDWDCPANMNCEAGVCVGTGVAPTCFLPPESFETVLPSIEIQWGGTFGARTVDDRPFGESTQAVISPVVANLTDDNGDGLVNEFDFPEILFMTFCGSSFTNNGVLRAIHGGGADKGGDLFAVLGPRLWRQGEELPADYNCGEGDLDPTSSLAVGDLDDPQGPEFLAGEQARRSALPEIVAMGEGDQVLVYDNEGVRVATSARVVDVGSNPAVSIANIDGQGMAEIIVGDSVLTLSRGEDGALQFLDTFRGNGGAGINGQGSISCVGDLVSAPGLEIVGGGTVYGLPAPPEGARSAEDCDEHPPSDPSEQAFCDLRLITLWDARDVNGTAASREGFCAVADVLGQDEDGAPGPENPLDGSPELIVIAGGVLSIFNGETGQQRRRINIPGANRGGAPNVDDFDGDGFPEVGTAFGDRYVQLDLQDASQNCPLWPQAWDDEEERPEANAPREPGGECLEDSDCAEASVCNKEVGQCVCLHNGWERGTEDNSSEVTGSTLFDFNGDGAAEVIYNDECWFRIYNGIDGEVRFKEASESRTRIEYPIVADVDNDGNAEIVFAVSNESGFCSEKNRLIGPNDQALQLSYNNGLEVWGDPSDRWVSARRVWNQHTYHVTNVMEDGRVPAQEPSGWTDLNGRRYNTYRSQPRSFGVAPDLKPISLQVVSPGEGCDLLSNLLEITTQIQNIGDLRVGPGVAVAFMGIWDGSEPIALEDTNGELILRTLQDSLEPGFISRFTVTYDVENNGTNPAGHPDEILVKVDAIGDAEYGAERECREGNNTASRFIEGSESLADLALTDVSLDMPIDCNDAHMRATVTNVGSLPAIDMVVRFYAGDPLQGGAPLAEVRLAGPLGPGESAEVEAVTEAFPYGSPVDVHAFVDPANNIEECNDGNNAGLADASVECFIR